MRLKTLVSVIVAAIITTAFLTGCGKDSSINENKSAKEVKSEAQNLEISKLKSITENYTKIINEKEKKFAEVSSKLKKLNVTQLVEDSGTKLNSKRENLKASIIKLKIQYDIYLEQLKKKQAK